ncbi:MAG: DUF616 domain-containing protein [Proteobacteria bacterium]|nr:DUF616 domain-containing protein [Pseudomonadota bacterium]
MPFGIDVFRLFGADRSKTIARGRRVIYTCMFGYSEPFADFPLELDENTDAICFTDDRTLRSRTWRFQIMNPWRFGPVRTSKMVKILAHDFVGPYGESLYIDNRVEPKVPIAQIFSYLDATADPMMTFRHPQRTCVYDEADVVVEHGIDKAEVVSAQMRKYRCEEFPQNAGLIAGSMLLRRHNDPAVVSVMKAWFEEVRRHSYRDQLSFNYVAWRQGFAPAHFPGELDNNDLMNWPVMKGPRLPRAFSEKTYLKLNPDVRKSKMTPREHYIKIGVIEGRKWC